MEQQHTSKSILYLVTAGFVLLAVNAGVWMGVQNGQLPPIDNTLLWGSLAALNTASLLWAVGLLGLQPLVVVCSYVVGGFLAYRGVRGISGIGTAEVVTAGATYGAIGALVVGDFTTKVRMVFFRRGQAPFIFVIAGLLVADSILNSQVIGMGQNVILNAVVFPFVFAGIAIGLVWTVVSRLGAAVCKPRALKVPVAEKQPVVQIPKADAAVGDSDKLMIQVPDTVEVEGESEKVAVVAATAEPVIKESLPLENKSGIGLAIEETAENESSEENFFPLEIDKDDEFVPSSSEEVGLVDLTDVLAVENGSSPVLETVPEPDFMEAMEEEPVFVSEPVEEPKSVFVPKPMEDPEPVFVPESVAVAATEPIADKKESADWLSDHLSLLNKISSKT